MARSLVILAALFAGLAGGSGTAMADAAAAPSPLPPGERPGEGVGPACVSGCDRFQAGDLSITVTNTYEALGDIRAAVYDSAGAFEARDTPVAAMVLRLSRPEARMTLGPLPPGRYAVRVFQDIDRDGEIGRSFLGIPTEPFGFSNDAMGSMGPPDFEAAAFEVRDEPVTIAIRLNR